VLEKNGECAGHFKLLSCKHRTSIAINCVAEPELRLSGVLLKAAIVHIKQLQSLALHSYHVICLLACQHFFVMSLFADLAL
jgi:hypothetical protein